MQEGGVKQFWSELLENLTWHLVSLSYSLRAENWEKQVQSFNSIPKDFQMSVTKVYCVIKQFYCQKTALSDIKRKQARHQTLFYTYLGKHALCSCKNSHIHPWDYAKTDVPRKNNIGIIFPISTT